MKKMILFLFLVVTYAEANSNTNESYFEDCNNYLFNIMLSETSDVIGNFQTILSNEDYENLIQKISMEDRFSLDKYNYKCLKDSIEFKESKISTIYDNLLSIYQPVGIEKIDFLPEDYPKKDIKYSVYNMDINIISNKNKLDITIYIQNSRAVSRILVEKNGKNIVVKNIDIQNLFVNLYNILELEADKKNKNREDKSCSYNDQILNYISPVGSYSSLTDIKWYCYPIYMDNKLLYNNKMITPNIPYIKDVLFDKIAIIKNTTINEVYRVFRKNMEFGIYTPLYPENIIKEQFKQHYYFNKDTKNVEELSAEPDNDEPSEPNEYVKISYYKFNNILKLTLRSSSSSGEYSLRVYKSYLLEQIGSDVKVIQFELF